MRIAVIKEEADEQMTLTSMKSDKRPHVQSIFASGPPPPSAPVAVPGTEYARNGELFSSSAPVTGAALERSSVDVAASAIDSRYIPGSRLIITGPYIGWTSNSSDLRYLGHCLLNETNVRSKEPSVASSL